MNRLQKIFTDTWIIRQHDLDAVMGLIMPCVINGNIRGAIEQLEKPKLSAQAVSPLSKCHPWDMEHDDLPSDSVCVIRLRDKLYSWHTESLIDTLKKAEANPNICGVVLDIDGPGGMTSYLPQAVDTIRNFSKPIATYVSGCMASAHFWLGTAAHKTFIASDICEVGCVGVICTLYSMAKFFEANGIDYREIYSDNADLKNKDSRDLFEKDDESGIKARANHMHQIFSEGVAQNLGIKLDPELPIFRGATYTGKEAVELGYIDKMGDLDDACRWVLGKATSRKALSI